VKKVWQHHNVMIVGEMESEGISQHSTPTSLAQQNKLHKTSVRFEPEPPNTLQVTLTNAYQEMN
jgi:hypothetical protein